MAELIDTEALSTHHTIDLREDGEVWLHDNAAAQDIQLDAYTATRLFDFLLLHMERLRNHAQAQWEAIPAQDDIDRSERDRRILAEGGTLDDPTGPAFS